MGREEFEIGNTEAQRTQRNQAWNSVTLCFKIFGVLFAKLEAAIRANLKGLGYGC